MEYNGNPDKFGKRDEESGFDYRGARFYDSDLGRFLSVDPLAADYAGWSGYGYVLGNPVRFIDPDGRKVDDIILSGTYKQKQQQFAYLQGLTNNKLALHPETGEVFTTQGVANSSKQLDAGTALIESLINSDKTTTIEIGNINGTDPVDNNGRTTDQTKADAGNGVGTHSKITFDPRSKGNSVVNADGTKGRPSIIGLAHELLHAFNNVSGTNKNKVTTNNLDPDDVSSRTFVTKEELNVRSAENEIRCEHNVVNRATPEQK